MVTIKMCWYGLCLATNNIYDTDCGDGNDYGGDEGDNDKVCTLGGRHRVGGGGAERRGGDLPGGK